MINLQIMIGNMCYLKNQKYNFMRKKIILLLFLNTFIFGLYNTPQNSFDLASWNGGSTFSNVYQNINPASYPLENRILISKIDFPDDISIKSVLVSYRYKKYLFKADASILDYGELEDFITKNNFHANDMKINLALKTTFYNIISSGLQLLYLNRSIESFKITHYIVKIGFRTSILEKRLGIGFVNDYILDSEACFISSTSLLGLYYKPLYFPGKFSLDITNERKNSITGTILIQINKRLDFYLGLTSDKNYLHTLSTFQNIYSGLGLGIDIHSKKYNLGFASRNIGQYGFLTGITIGFKY